MHVTIIGRLSLSFLLDALCNSDDMTLGKRERKTSEKGRREGGGCRFKTVNLKMTANREDRLQKRQYANHIFNQLLIAASLGVA
jgi:hypothetical protein